MRRFDRLLGIAVLMAGASLSSGGHAQEDGDDDDAPPGAGQQAAGPQGGNPHGSNGPQMFQPPPDTNDEDPRLAAGTISITILDPDNVPLPGTAVTLGILHNSVAKGESREHKLAETDAGGAATFANLDHASGTAFRVSVVKDGGTFWASPFALPADKGIRVTLHVYPVTHDITKAVVVAQVVVFAEMKDDRVQLEQAITLYNLGRVAWVPENVMLGLPADFTALNAQETMTGEGVAAVDKQGALLHGTYGPGQHTLDFRFQLPYAEEKNVTFDETLIPHVAVMRVMAAASQEMKLVVSGFPEAQPRTDAQGQRILITERQMRSNDPPLTSVHVELRDLPTPGPGKWVATLLSALAVLGGLGLAFTAKGTATAGGSPKQERERLLSDLEDLERAHKAGDIGPKTYERARRELIDAIARTLSASKGA